MSIKKVASGILFGFTIMLFTLSLSHYWTSMLAGEKIPLFINALIDIGFISAASLWFWMLGSFFKAGPSKGRVAIGFAMLFFNLLAAPIYWATYYVRKPNT